ncbi:helix-turn-helix transcriptional regulator [Streptomyces sp. NBC_00063]|uniref:helix-turn-helix domain-containing protein n=1 Tax=Streptomyces sp. NBC_00063 TaxID=2975638 RepID=UPI002251ED40|nr:helix-turn-helix transcriptional regulator [Streptomyces sp. NBC_00063]MCX5443893.1 helix-turn-helix transcriptional regulator [Streptomyces sp. NBC_00063]
MGRPEKPIRTLNPYLMTLATYLRETREEAGLTYAELAARTRHIWSATTLQRAAGGERIPRLQVVEAYVLACGPRSAERARRLWRHARSWEHGANFTNAPRPLLVASAADLRAALRATYYKAGAMPLREMERRAGLGRLPRTTVRRMLDGATMLDQEQLRSFLTVCDVPERDHQDWLDAWTRVWKRNTVDELHARRLVDEMTVRMAKTTKVMSHQLMDRPPPTRQLHSPRTLSGGVAPREDLD